MGYTPPVSPNLEVSFSTTSTGAQILASTDAANYRSAVIHMTSVGSGLQFTVQTSDDNTNWVTAPVRAPSTVSNAWSTSSFSSATMYEVKLLGRYCRINVSAMTGGTTAGVVEFYTIPPQGETIEALEDGTWTVVPQHSSYSHINSNATTVVKSGSGTLGRIVVNTKGASSNTATVYDSTSGSGTVIGALDTTAQTGAFLYDVKFSTGLTIVTATGTAPDLTVVYT